MKITLLQLNVMVIGILSNKGKILDYIHKAAERSMFWNLVDSQREVFDYSKRRYYPSFFCPSMLVKISLAEMKKLFGL